MPKTKELIILIPVSCCSLAILIVSIGIIFLLMNGKIDGDTLGSMSGKLSAGGLVGVILALGWTIKSSLSKMNLSHE